MKSLENTLGWAHLSGDVLSYIRRGKWDSQVGFTLSTDCSSHWSFSHFLRCWSNKDSIIYARDNINREEKDEIVKRIGEIADGVFQFSDIHEHGGTRLALLLFFWTWVAYTGFLQRREDLKRSPLELRRSQSTGCLDDKSDHESEFPIIDSGKSWW